jgi:hypothetical protein
VGTPASTERLYDRKGLHRCAGYVERCSNQLGHSRRDILES